MFKFDSKNCGFLDDLSISKKSVSTTLQTAFHNFSPLNSWVAVHIYSFRQNTLWHLMSLFCLCIRKNVYISTAWILLKLLLCLEWLMVSLQSALKSTNRYTHIHTDRAKHKHMHARSWPSTPTHTNTHTKCTILQNHWFCFE